MRLDEREAHHAVHVMRLRAGDQVEILDGAGGVYDCRITTVHKSSVELQVIQQHSVPPLPWQITLFQALPKGKAFDLIVEKATELGAHRVVPIRSERVVGDYEENERRLERWRLTAIDAIKQCGSPWLTMIDPPVSLKAAVDFIGGLDFTLVASLHPGAQHPGKWFQSVPLAPRVNIGIWVGPEGDFSPDEMADLTKGGAWPITLGSLVLRAETAAIYCLSIINYEMQRRFDRGTELLA
jgi:16S rRNA (uracil1498-N3)-methyltransferase